MTREEKIERQLNEVRFSVARLRAVIENTQDLEVLDYLLGG